MTLSTSLPGLIQPQAEGLTGTGAIGASAPSGSGLGGLFNRIFSGLTEGLEGAQDLTSFTSNLDLGEFGDDLTAGDLGTLANDLLGALQGDSELSAAFQGEIVAVRITVVEIETTVAQFDNAGIDLASVGSLEELVSAFQQLGDDGVLAESRAERLESLLAFVKNRLGVSGDSLGTNLTEVAALAPAVQQVASFVSVRVTQFTAQSSAFASAAQQAPITDVGTLVLQGKPLVPSDALASQTAVQSATRDVLFGGQVAQNNLTPTASAAATPEATAVLSQQVADLAPEQAILTRPVSAAATAGIAEVGLANREAAPRASDVRDNRRVSAVQPGEGLQAPRGVEVYRWQVSTTTGLDTLTQLNNPEALSVALDDAGADQALTQLSREASQGSVSETARTDPRVPFSDRLLQAARAQVTQQASVQLTQTAKDGGGTVRIKLNPEELGTINIELEVLNGRVQGSISADRPEVIEQMARDLQLLKQSLETAGFSLGDNGLSLQLTQDGADNNDAQHANNGSHAGTSEDLDGTDGESDAPQRWLAPDRLLDLNV